MLYFICAAVSLIATVCGAVCGIGGGVIIKPVLDATGAMGVSAASFLSSCTVLAMSVISVLRGARSKSSALDLSRTTPLAVGAALGGFLGKSLFSLLVEGLGEKAGGVIQAGLLMGLTVFTLAYTLNSAKIKTHNAKGAALCLAAGVALGCISSFLGIGGGPINLVLLGWLFSMDTKCAAINSLYIITISQFVALGQTVLTASVPAVDPWLLVLMAVCGLTGGFVGSYFNKRMTEGAVRKLFIALMAAIILICAYNGGRLLMA